MKSKKEKLEFGNKNDNVKKIDLIKKSDDYCIINGNKIEGNACSTILNQK